MNQEALEKALHDAEFLHNDLMDLLSTENRAGYLLVLEMITSLRKTQDQLKFLKDV